MTAPDLAALAGHCRVTPGEAVRLADHDPADRMGLSKDDADAMLAAGAERLAALHERLFAQRAWSVLLVLQGMDASGKDGAIKRLAAGLNPQGLRIASFAAPNAEERSHDFLRRIHLALPPRGMVGIFNRSHYEEVLVVRVHPELLERQHLPAALTGKRLWAHRLADITGFERYLARQGLVVLKFFLHVSRAEQKRRLLDRLDHPAKNWKFSANDVTERHYWDDYMASYEDTIVHTATKDAPWFVIPADHKWFARLVVVTAMIAALEALDLRAPKLPESDLARLAAAREELLKD